MCRFLYLRFGTKYKSYFDRIKLKKMLNSVAIVLAPLSLPSKLDLDQSGFTYIL